MFGGTKPTFGSTTTGTSFGGFNNAATAAPFGQSAFGKPATNAFGAGPTFGAQQATPSLFGANPGQQQSTGLFGGASTSSAFGTTTPAQPTFGGFTQQQQNTSIFGAAQPTANSSSLFGQPTSSAFGAAVKPGGLGTFGQTTGAGTTSLFGQPTASMSTSSFGTFGQTAATTTNAFGTGATSAFGQPAAGGTNPGTSIAKYQPTIGTDTLMKGGQPNSVNTKQHCITAMKEYDAKSLEELRMEDYLANRKGPQAGTSSAGGFFGAPAQPNAAGTGLFGTSTQQTTGLFGQQATAGTENKSIFGTSAFGQAATSAFGAAAPQQNSFLTKPFGAPANTGFGNDAAANPFGAKPTFGQAQTTTPSLFGQTSAANTTPAFGQPNAFGGFGTTTGTQQPTLFGAAPVDANKPAFGLGAVSTANTGFGGFGNTATSTAGTGLFGTKPATGFGSTPAFGATSTANTGFTNFSIGNTSGGLFNSNLNKPATSGFTGFGTQTATNTLNFNAGTAGSTLFGNTAAKPGGLFGNTLGTNTGTTGIFGGATNTFGTNNTLGGSFGSNTLGGVNPALNPSMQPQTVPIHQQILSKVTSPYGDNPIFKDLKRTDETDALRATDPAAQKAILETTNSQFKVLVKASPSTIKVKPVSNTFTKKSLFEGLEEYDASVETFSLKPNAKRLIIKPKNNPSAMIGSGATTPNASFISGNNTSGTPQRQVNNMSLTSTSALRNESFCGEIPIDPVTGSSNAIGKLNSATNSGNDNDISRRESWLHPNNLEKVRQLNAVSSNGRESMPPLNSTLSELVPRKPLETYNSGSSANTTPITTRATGSSETEKVFEEQVSTSITRRETVTFSDNANDSLLSNRSYGADERSSVLEDLPAEYDEHPTGITLRRVGYYTIPSLDDLKSYLAEDGTCIVPNFTVGREGYGNVYFGKEMDVVGLNLDEIVHFRNKEIIIYPDDENKPAIGNGLNREAQVTLDQVWPIDKTKHEAIKDPVRLAEMDWEGKLRRVCDKNDTRFIEYRPETGSWVFRVKHFSKYGLNDSDEDDDNVPTDPKKAKMGAVATMPLQLTKNAPTATTDNMILSALKNVQKVSDAGARALDPKVLSSGGFHAMDETSEFMLMDKTQYFKNNGHDYSMFGQPIMKTVSSAVVSPTTVLAKESGTDAHRLQLMKASLFGDDDDNKSVASDVDDQYRAHFNKNLPSGFFGSRPPYDLVSAQSLWKDAGDAVGMGMRSGASSQLDLDLRYSPAPASSAASVTSLIPEEEHMDRAAGGIGTMTSVGNIIKSTPFIIKPKLVQIRGMVAQSPFVLSFTFPLRNKWTCDLGLYNSRRFKVGFGPQNTLIVPTTQNNLKSNIKCANFSDVKPQIFKLRLSNDFSSTLLQNVKISSVQHYAHFKESIVDHLQIQLRNSLQEEVEGSECPYIKSDGGTDLIMKHLNEAIKQINLSPIEEYAVSVWSLCLALWGDHDELEGQEASSHFAVMCRRNLLSEWLENTLTDKDLLTKSVSKHTYLDHLLDLVMCHKVTEACELAFQYDDANLAMLLSQLSSGPVVRQLVEDQLAAWHKDKADNFIQLERLKLYMLVAGVSLMNSAHGPINTFDGVEWIKVLANQLWYLSSPTASITDTLIAYEKSFKSEEFYSLPPTPSYRDKVSTYDSRTIYDLRYHLLQLFSKRSHPMESLLNPATHTADPMDFRLSWSLLQTLEALGYRHCSELSESQLHVGFASQLENYDLWEWSVFVLLHIKGRNQRELAVQNMLYRYVNVSKDVTLSDKEKFVINNLGVPEKWIDYAKAVKAGSLGNRHLQAKYLLKAKQWALAHEVIFQYIAPDTIINDDLEYLNDLLCQFEGDELHKSVKVPNWSNQGQIFLDFIEINEKFKCLKTLKTPADIETRWENLKPQLADLCSRINLLPCPTAKHRLCQSEIAQNLACLVRGVLLVCPELNPCLIIKIALERLPLPQEFAQQELRSLLDTLVVDLSKAHADNSNTEIVVK